MQPYQEGMHKDFVRFRSRDRLCPGQKEDAQVWLCNVRICAPTRRSQADTCYVANDKVGLSSISHLC